MTACVDLGAIRSNVDVIRSLAGDRTLMACMTTVEVPVMLTGKAAYAYVS